MNPVLFDRMGSVASASCALHCLTFAVAPAVAGALGIGFLANEKVEWTLFAAAIVFALLASGLGVRVHRNRRVLGGFGLGIALLSAAGSARPSTSSLEPLSLRCLGVRHWSRATSRAAVASANVGMRAALHRRDGRSRR